MSRCCGNCFKNNVDEAKQNFYYRDWIGNKWDASCRPVCDQCIEAGEYKEEVKGEVTIHRLYLGTSRLYIPENNHGWGWFDE
ncbi:hypothetical protein M5X02_31520 [Paenibacillus alvei]|uniref:hypothetical protein n=1 Tax=Paenibacillus alvei TaxID=44250 RepID=UPI0002884E45|nr:hypothetical protein [Paenibacillus alvei]EJW13958.1 hypothetical protein PAV_141p00640 [Paenibacillus alvei DSM 29]MCY9545158.1 hypothetical protein [Paenibacillus alvei]MCY9707679.1 hypothetical protein [Paenibacillus alvei]MEC0082808.1 hypothetical protein [Paenibacillus alvei]